MNNKIVSTEDRGVTYVTGDKNYSEPQFLGDIAKRPKNKYIEYNIPDDRILYNINGCAIALPADMRSLLNKIDNIGKPKTLWQIIKEFFYGKSK